jgi:hypothetical protein
VLDTQTLLLNRRHGMELFCLLLVLLLALVVYQHDIRWLAPISPILLYSLVSITHEPISTDAGETPAAAEARRLQMRRPSLPAGTQGLSIFGMSVRLPTPARSQRRPSRATIEEIEGDASHDITTTSTRSSSARAAVASSPLHRPQAHRPIAFPSLVTPVPSRSHVHPGSRAGRATILDQEDGDQAERHAQQREHLDEERKEVEQDAIAAPIIQISSPSRSPQIVSVTSPRSPLRASASPTVPVESIAASLTPPLRAVRVSPRQPQQPSASKNAQQEKRSLIDVQATLSRLGEQEQIAPGIVQPSGPLARQTSVEVTEGSASDAESSSAAPSSLHLSSLSFLPPFFRCAPSPASLSSSHLSTDSFSVRFTFRHSFVAVKKAFLAMGAGEDGPEGEGERREQSEEAVTPPRTPTASRSAVSLAHSMSMGQLNFLSPTMMEPQQREGQREGQHQQATSRNAAAARPSAQLFTMSDVTVDVISDNLVDLPLPGSTDSDSTSGPLTLHRQLVRRVSTPMRLPQLIRKLLGGASRLTMEERVQYSTENDEGVMMIQLVNRDLTSYFTIYSTQTIAPHPSNPGQTLWTCRYTLYSYATCGPMRANVQTFIVGMTKARQQQISSLISAAVKREVRRRAAEAQAQQEAAIREQMQWNSGSGIKQRVGPQIKRHLQQQ